MVECEGFCNRLEDQRSPNYFSNISDLFLGEINPNSCKKMNQLWEDWNQAVCESLQF